MRWERWSPPSGLGATCPMRCFCCDQRLALARLTPKRSAACRQVAPANSADATRWRRSTDKVVGMASSLPRQRSLAQHSFRSDELRSKREMAAVEKWLQPLTELMVSAQSELSSRRSEAMISGPQVRSDKLMHEEDYI